MTIVNYICAFMLLVVSGFTFSQDSLKINQTDDRGLKQGKWIYQNDHNEMLRGPAEIHADFVDDTIHGDYEVYTLGGKLIVHYKVTKGIRTGIGYEYYLSGKIHRIYYLLADREAHTLEFDGKSRLSWEYTQKEHKMVGPYKSYRKGKLFILKNYNDEGQLDGPFIYYYSNGQERHVLLFKDDVAVRQKRYSRSGKLLFDSDTRNIE